MRRVAETEYSVQEKSSERFAGVPYDSMMGAHQAQDWTRGIGSLLDSGV